MPCFDAVCQVCGRQFQQRVNCVPPVCSFACAQAWVDAEHLKVRSEW